MAKQTLPTNYQDDVMSSAMGAKRKWQITQNTDGTYNIEDVTTYDKVGTDFGAGDINATNQAVNQSADVGKIIDDPDTAAATTEEGYIAGVQLFNHLTDSLNDLKNVQTYDLLTTLSTTSQSINLTDYKKIFMLAYNTTDMNILGTVEIPIFIMSGYKYVTMAINDTMRVIINIENNNFKLHENNNSATVKLYGVK